MKQVIYEMTEKGQLDQIIKKWAKSDLDCTPLLRQGKALSIEKLSFLFIIILFGFSLAIITLLFEKLFGHIRSTRNMNNRVFKSKNFKSTSLKNKLNLYIHDLKRKLITKQIQDPILFSLIEDIQNQCR